MILRFNIPDDQVNTVIEAICFTYSYQETLSDGSPNPQTKAQFAKERVVEFMRDAVRNYKRAERMSNFAQTVESDVSTTSISAL